MWVGLAGWVLFHCSFRVSVLVYIRQAVLSELMFRIQNIMSKDSTNIKMTCGDLDPSFPKISTSHKPHARTIRTLPSTTDNTGQTVVRVS
jgi:hypothetical protein